jgi:chromate reductase, NAD(P)H dehydrogenase (quinone)
MPEESRLAIPLLLGTSRVGSRSALVARFLLGELDRQSGIDTELIDLAALDLPVMRHRLGATDSPPTGAIELSAKLKFADGLLIVAPEYKNGYPGSLKNAIDYLEAGILRRKPIGIATVSSGGFGGINCLAQLRLVCLALGGVPIPVALPVSRVEEAFDQECGLRDPKLAARTGPFLEELVWYTHALARQRGRDATTESLTQGSLL